MEMAPKRGRGRGRAGRGRGRGRGRARGRAKKVVKAIESDEEIENFQEKDASTELEKDEENVENAPPKSEYCFSTLFIPIIG